MTRRRFGSFRALVPALMVAGCAVGPDFRSPPPPAATGYTPETLVPETASAAGDAGAAQRFVASLDIPGQWWTLFRSQPLDALIADALKANADLTAAQAALRVAQENVAAQRGAWFPTVGASVSPSRNKTPTGSLSPASASGNPYYSLTTLQVSVSYTPDIFGLVRRSVESLRAQADAQSFQLEATYLTLTSNLVAAAVQDASLRAQIAATEEIVKIESDSLELFRRQNALGQIAVADVVAQEAALAQTQQALPPLQKQLAQARDLLAALSGRLPSDPPAETFDLAALHLPEDLPVTLPATLVEQRPDLRAADANLHSASALIGVAIADRLPNLTLSADAGSAASRIGGLFAPGTGFWTIAGTLAQPVFDGGTLLHKERAATAAFDEAAAQYRSTLVTAFQNVADTLRALQSDADALKAAVTAESAARHSLDIARRQLQLGQVGYLALLSAQQLYQQARISLVQAQAGRFADTAALFQALGGGWWNRNDIAAANDAAAK